uniref:Uncharacterized protein n=2 Tax=Phaeomonas parva TaxID=124430 RepID=A0A7S1U1Q3_9STRA|mmetsp:Transcript_27704/g.87898  ORF Transcript_27704/g.87898 Transcript_27704/m.87898 type:complete len:211 (+) Transcript_27704:351-983(+)
MPVDAKGFEPVKKSGRQEVLLLLKYAAALIAACVALVFSRELLPYGDPEDGFLSNWTESLVRFPYSAFVLYWGCPIGYMHLLAPGEMRLRDQHACAFVAALTGVVMHTATSLALGVYPLPYRPVLIGLPAAFAGVLMVKLVTFRTTNFARIRDCALLCVAMVVCGALYIALSSRVLPVTTLGYFGILLLPCLKTFKRTVCKMLVGAHHQG